MTATLIPVPFTVTRYRCPLCSRTRSSKKAIGEHIARCWLNPAARSCKTCDHYDPGSNGCWGDPMCNCASGEDCRAGVDLVDGLPINCPKWTEGDQQP